MLEHVYIHLVQDSICPKDCPVKNDGRVGYGSIGKQNQLSRWHRYGQNTCHLNLSSFLSLEVCWMPVRCQKRGFGTLAEFQSAFLFLLCPCLGKSPDLPLSFVSLPALAFSHPAVFLLKKFLHRYHKLADTIGFGALWVCFVHF